MNPNDCRHRCDCNHPSECFFNHVALERQSLAVVWVVGAVGLAVALIIAIVVLAL